MDTPKKEEQGNGGAKTQCRHATESGIPCGCAQCHKTAVLPECEPLNLGTPILFSTVTWPP